MENGFLVIVISDKGIEKTKLYHGENKEATDNILKLYGRIMPYLKHLNRLATDERKEIVK